MESTPENAIKHKDINERPSDEYDAQEWRIRPHLTLLIERIPRHWMVAELKAFLDSFGNVVRVEFFEDREVP
jgi:hypothetical protein